MVIRMVDPHYSAGGQRVRCPRQSEPCSRWSSSGLVTGWAIAIPIGAVGALLVALTARTSLRSGPRPRSGWPTVDGVYAAARRGRRRRHRRLTRAVRRRVARRVRARAAGDRRPDGLACLAQRGRSAAAAASARDLRPWQAFTAFLAITAVNPTTVVYFAAVVLGNPRPHRRLGRRAWCSWRPRSWPAPRGSSRWPSSARLLGRSVTSRPRPSGDRRGVRAWSSPRSPSARSSG